MGDMLFDSFYNGSYYFISFLHASVLFVFLFFVGTNVFNQKDIPHLNQDSYYATIV